MCPSPESSPPRTQLLFVDDDPSVTRAFALTMGRQTDFEIVTAHSADEALARGEEGFFSVVVTDLDMPDGDGLSLMRRWREVSPDTVFVVVTGIPNLDLDLDRDVDDAISAIVCKPWDNATLASVLYQARELYDERLRPSGVMAPSLETTALIIEDNPADAVMLRVQLGGFRPKLGTIDHLPRLDVALERLRRQTYSVIFVDLSLPDARGLDTVRHVRLAAPESVVVVHSGHEDDALAAQALRLGAQDVWVKGTLGAREKRRALTFAFERKRAERALTRLAHHDALTGLANRVAFDDRLRHAMALARRRDAALSVLFIDLDGFKAVNDTHGHDKGDELLQVVARRLRHTVRECDTVARLGGDEFAVLLEDGKLEPRVPAQRIIDVLEHPVRLDAERVAISASVGIAVFPDHGRDAAALLRAADEAMYRAKREGKGRFASAPPAARKLTA